MSRLEHVPKILASNLYPTLASSAAIGLLQLGCRCLTLSLLTSCALGGSIYVAGRIVNNYAQTKVFGPNWHVIFDQKINSKALDLACTALTGAVGTLVFEMIASGATAAILPTLATGVLTGVVIYTATKVAAFIIGKVLSYYLLFQIHQETKTFFRWVTFQTYTYQEEFNAVKAIVQPLQESKEQADTLIKKINERTYPLLTKKLEKRNELELAINDQLSPWVNDDPTEQRHQMNYHFAKTDVIKTLSAFLKEIETQTEEAKKLQKNLREKYYHMESLAATINYGTESVIDDLDLSKISLKMELKLWQNV
jgi:hypothetical protein